jgi:phospholipid transport system substrate-binding protein
LPVFLFLTIPPISAHAGQPETATGVEAFNTALLESMKRSGKLGFSGRYELLEPVIREGFALPFMAEKSVGRYWKGLTEEQQKKLVDVFIDWTVSTYAGRFDSYSGERFEVISETEPLRGTVTVISRLIEPDGDVVEFHYKLRSIKGIWRIVDIRISGVSQLAMNRSQFVSMLKREGFEALLSKLKEKTESYRKED